MSGQILVSGKNKLEIDLKYGKPDAVIVEFKHKHTDIPCDPHCDVLEWALHEKHHGFVLEIRWHVSNAREIIWGVNFA